VQDSAILSDIHVDSCIHARHQPREQRINRGSVSRSDRVELAGRIDRPNAKIPRTAADTDRIVTDGLPENVSKGVGGIGREQQHWPRRCFSRKDEGNGCRACGLANASLSTEEDKPRPVVSNPPGYLAAIGRVRAPRPGTWRVPR